MYRSLLIALCSLLALGGVLSTGLAGQAGRQEEDLTKRVVRLEAALKQATATVTEQGRTQREIGEDVPDFVEAMRRVLRQDPDVILLGEMRDLDTIDVSNQKMYLESLNKNRFRESVTFEEFEVSEESGPSLVGRMAAAWWC